MDGQRETAPNGSEPTKGGQFSWPKLGLWLPASMAAGVVAAWFAEIAQAYFAPLLIFPILVGLGLGAMLIAVMRFAHVANRPTVVLGTLLATSVTIVGQHYFFYRATQEKAGQFEFESIRHAFPEWAGERLPQPADSFSEFLDQQAAKGRPMVGGIVARGWLAWLTWTVDGLLVLAGAGAVVIPSMRLPYCNQCRKWYRTIRSTRIDTSMAQRAAELADVSPPERPTSARYRLSACPGGCSPTRLELSWETHDGSTYLARTWLDAATRNRLMQMVDEPGGTQ